MALGRGGRKHFFFRPRRFCCLPLFNLDLENLSPHNRPARSRPPRAQARRLRRAHSASEGRALVQTAETLVWEREGDAANLRKPLVLLFSFSFSFSLRSSSTSLSSPQLSLYSRPHSNPTPPPHYRTFLETSLQWCPPSLSLSSRWSPWPAHPPPSPTKAARPRSRAKS